MPLRRLVALDLMRGLVMALMAIDHSSDAFNAGRIFTDSAGSWHAGAELPAAQFLVRWITHLCAPTFVFLAGTSLAFSIRKELSRGKSERSVDWFLFTRGLAMVTFEFWISYFIMPAGVLLLQVLYAIGTSYMLMILLRRIDTRISLALALGSIVSLELACGFILTQWGEHTPIWAMLLLLPGNPPHVVIGYPTLHWLALMLLGWCFGNYLLRRPQVPAELSRKLMAAGGLSLLIFAVVRALNGYGNMGLYRDGTSLVQWLHVSKYPPSLSYDTLELGLCFLFLAGFFRLAERRAPGPGNLLLVLGQTPMFFYLLHFPLLELSAKVLGVDHKLGIAAAFLGAATVVVALYPACRVYGRYKAAHPGGWTRYV